MNTYIQKIKNNRKTVLLVLVVLVLGIILGRVTGTHPHTQTVVDATGNTSESTIWTCSMHPQIRQDTPGICPLCGMDLTPVEDEQESDLPPQALKMSQAAMALAKIHTEKVSFGATDKQITLAGKVSLDPTFAFSQTAHFPGRVEQLYVNSIGQYVTKGQMIASLYSAELISAQKELLQAYENRQLYPGVFQAVKEKLLLWKISENQIQAILDQGTVIRNFPIHANHSGYLVQKNIEAGQYLESGTSMFEISQLDKLWVNFDVYEKDASFIQKGMSITYSLPAMPSKEFTSTIAFVEPLLNPLTRTLTARIHITNKDLAFKPEMLVNGVVVSKATGQTDKIVVPKSAVMWTGKNSVVYVKYQSDSDVGFVMHPVVLGVSLGDSYVIEEGLEPGQEIVVQGTFSVDAAAQLANKPSMMNHVHPATQKLNFVESELDAQTKVKFKQILESYFALKDALVEDQNQLAAQKYKDFISLWKKQEVSGFSSTNQKALEQANQRIIDQEKRVSNTQDIELLRTEFNALSTVLIQMSKAFGSPMGTIYVQYCPMVDGDVGADWLSAQDQVLNPYFGSSMLTCGEVSSSID